MFNVHNNSPTLFVYVCSKFLHWPDWCPSSSDSLTNFLTFLFVRTFNISVCQNQIMYVHKHIMQCALETDCLHHNIIKLYVRMVQFYHQWSSCPYMVLYGAILQALFLIPLPDLSMEKNWVRVLLIFLYSCKIKSGNGLVTRVQFYH